jgi:hypothetical protein
MTILHHCQKPLESYKYGVIKNVKYTKYSSAAKPLVSELSSFQVETAAELVKSYAGY